jgi:glycosyltransferase involved in cell wall biosynthesis
MKPDRDRGTRPPELSLGPARRIVLTANTAWYLKNFRLGLIRALISRGCKVWVWAPEDRYFPALAEAGATTVHLPINGKGLNPVEDLRLTHAYRRRLRELRPDALLTFTIKPVIYGGLVAGQLGIPCLSTITGLGTAFIREGWLTRVAETMYRRGQRKAAKVFFQNPDDRALFIKRRIVEAQRTQVVPGSGINLQRFQPVPLPSSQRGDVVFLLIGRMLRDKGVLEFEEAARVLKSEFPNARFQLLGAADVPNRTAISREQLASWQAEGVIEYLGESDDVRAQIAAADCVVLPSYREGIPRTLLEGGAMGRPLVATDVPGCREVVRDGVNGYLCEARSVVALAAAMRRVALMEPAERAALGRVARAGIERDYDENRVIAAYCAALGLEDASALGAAHDEAIQYG